MLVLLSPSKTLKKEIVPPVGQVSSPALLEESKQLIEVLRKYSVYEVQTLMKLSDFLAQLNYERFQAFTTPFTQTNAKQAILTFSGDVYDGLSAGDFSAAEHAICQQKIRILSGLYGVLRPNDLMQAYRLEMGTRLATTRGKNLYAFWGDRITQELNATPGSELIINLASNEYFKAVKPKLLKGKLITVNFKEYKDGKYKTIGLFAKRARGMMARYIVQHDINDTKELLAFDEGGYAFHSTLSSEDELVFTRSADSESA